MSFRVTLNNEDLQLTVAGLRFVSAMSRVGRAYQKDRLVPALAVRTELLDQFLGACHNSLATRLQQFTRIVTLALLIKACLDVLTNSSSKSNDGGGPREQDLEALPKILDTLLGQGFEFVTITELMKADGKVPEEIISGKAKMPEGAVWPTELA